MFCSSSSHRYWNAECSVFCAFFHSPSRVRREGERGEGLCATWLGRLLSALPSQVPGNDLPHLGSLCFVERRENLIPAGMLFYFRFSPHSVRSRASSPPPDSGPIFHPSFFQASPTVISLNASSFPENGSSISAIPVKCDIIP